MVFIPEGESGDHSSDLFAAIDVASGRLHRSGNGITRAV